MMRALSLAALSLLVSSAAWGHARLLTPTPRTNDSGIKTGPCGGIAPTGNPTVYAPGSTIMVEFEETIEHPGHYRIAFSPGNDEGFDDNVLMDNIPDEPGATTDNPNRYSQPVILPDMECEGCTLQLIQCMTETGACVNYYSCADITLSAAAADGGLLDDAGPGADGGGGDGADAAGPPSGVGDAPGLCSVAAASRRGSSPATGLGLLVFLVAALAYRTRPHNHP